MCGVLKKPVAVSPLVANKTKWSALIKAAEQAAIYSQVFGLLWTRRTSELTHLQAHVVCLGTAEWAGIKRSFGTRRNKLN